MLPAVVVALAAVGLAVGFALADDDDDDRSAAVALGNVQQACLDWAEDRAASGPDEEWCARMTAWMYDQGAARRMSAGMMWGDADRMLETCRRWAIADPPAEGSAAEAAQWCGEMVGWMQQHMDDDWDRWMMHDRMGN